MNITGWLRKPTRGQSGAMLVTAFMFCVVSYNLYYCCQIKQRELEERQRELVRGAPFVIVRGRVDNEQSGFPNIIADSFRRCPLPGFIEEVPSHNFG